MTPDGRPVERIPPFRVVDLIIIILGVIMAVSLIVTFRQNDTIAEHQDELKAVQADGIVRGYKTRAATCDLMYALGLRYAASCDDPAIEEYLDGAVQFGQSPPSVESMRTRELLCLLVTQQSATVPPEERFVVPESLCPAP